MPSVLIEVRRPYSTAEEAGIIEAVHASLREAFKIHPTDKTLRLIVHEPRRFVCPPDKPRPEYYTHISIDCISGRSLDAKRNLYREIVERLEPFGIPRDHVKILLREITLENWGIRGGQAGCDVDLGFDVNV